MPGVVPELSQDWIEIEIEPRTVILDRNGTQQFSASVTASRSGILLDYVWSVDGDATITADGLLTVGSNAADNSQITVRATTVYDSDVYDEVVVYVQHVVLPKVLSVTVTPNPATSARGGTVQFTATVEVEGGASQAVTWSLSGNQNGNTNISNAGLLRVHNSQGRGTTLTITAISDFNPNVRGTATCTVS
jgi:hypothetical protein